MANTWGNNIKISIFGESHGVGIGIVIDGLPSGLEIDIDAVKIEMARRAPGKNKLSTQRQEKDKFEILSGFFMGKTTGTPLCAVIYNNDKKSKDYSKLKSVMRPGHADYSGFIRYNGFNDYRGGGHFSGRLTAPLVFAGAIAMQILKRDNIIIGSHISSIHEIRDTRFIDLNTSEIQSKLNELKQMDIPVLELNKQNQMEEVILSAKEDQNSVGGEIEVIALNIPAGLGDPFFDSVESRVAHMMFSIPGVKGIEFGRGFELSKMYGQEANDEYVMMDGEVKTLSNNNGGILGGITNGMPVVFNTVLKPTPSIGKTQQTINIETNENTTVMVEGRHDPCIVTRAVPVLEAATALVILDLMVERNGRNGQSK